MPPGGMADMMNNPMMKTMMQNPDFMKQAMSMMQSGNMNPAELAKNPSFSKLLENPDFLGQAVEMLKDPNNA